MNKLLQLILFTIITVAIACTTATNSGTTTATATDTTATAKAGIDFSHIQLASKKDTSCGMPLSAGLEDTVLLNGKVYGFCSKECKDSFVNKLIAENKR